MPLDVSVKPLLEYWIRQQKEAERQRDKALADGKLWFNRAKLAMSVNKLDMAAEAKARALDAKERFERARLRLDIIEAERDLLRSNPANRADVAASARERRQHAMQEFKRLGIDPGFALDVPDPLADPGDDDAVLQRLRERMAADRSRAAGSATAADLSAADAEIAAELQAEVDAEMAGTPPADSDLPRPPGRRFETIGED